MVAGAKGAEGYRFGYGERSRSAYPNWQPSLSLADNNSASVSSHSYAFPPVPTLSHSPSLSDASPASARSSFSAPWSSRDSPTDNFLSPHLSQLRGPNSDVRRLSSGSVFTDTFVPTHPESFNSPDSRDSQAGKDVEPVVRLSRHSRSLSGLSGWSASVPLTPYSESVLPLSSVPYTIRDTDMLAPQLVSQVSSLSPQLREESPNQSSNPNAQGYEREAESGGIWNGSFRMDQEKNLPLGHLQGSDEALHTTHGDLGPVRSKKAKDKKTRERMRIALAPDQPPTTQGKQRERVYVACRQCRGRKIRCDGAKPMCFNCNHRGSPTCDYDTVPKRRGPDRQPGSRQRSGKGESVRPRRRTSSRGVDTAVSSTDNTAVTPLSPQLSHPSHGCITLQQIKSSPSSGSGSQRGLDMRVSPESSSSWTQLNTPPNFGSSNYHDSPLNDNAIFSTAPTTIVQLPLPVSPLSFDVEEQFNKVAGYGNVSVSAHPSAHTLLPQISTNFSAPSNNPIVTPDAAYSSKSPVVLNHLYPTFTSPFSTSDERLYPQSQVGISLQHANGRNQGLVSTESFEAFAPRMQQSVVPCNEFDFAPNTQTVVHPHGVPIVDMSTVSRKPPSSHSNPPLFAPKPNGSFIEPTGYNPYQWAAGSLRRTEAPSAFITSEDGGLPPSHHYSPSLYQSPGFDFVRKTWWDSLLDTYCVEPYCSSTVSAYYRNAYSISVSALPGTFASGAARYHTSQIIVQDIKFLFEQSNFWFAFINYPRFFQTFYRQRESMQPALVLVILTWSNLIRSSTAELGDDGMRRTLWLKEKAQAALEAAISVNVIDPELAQAAWLLCVFEISSQPMRKTSRIKSSLQTLDSIIRTLSLSSIDAPLISDVTPASAASKQSSGVSHVLPSPLYMKSANRLITFRQSPQLLQYRSENAPLQAVVTSDHSNASNSVSSSIQTVRKDRCRCKELCLGYGWREAKQHVPFWLCTPMWNPRWTDAEVRREECRRLCWNTLLLFASYTSYCASLGVGSVDLFLCEPSNYHNIFPGENLTDCLASPTLSPAQPKLETVWALYSRCMLLWHACLRINDVSDSERAVFANAVWLECEAIEEALDAHTCDTERAFLFQGREYLFNARMFVTQEFRRFVPHPSLSAPGAVHRLKAEEFLTHQATLCKRVMLGLQTVTGLPGNMLGRRPFFTGWFMAHISRCIQLWKADRGLQNALELAKSFMAPIDYLASLWPSEDQRNLYTALHAELSRCCLEAGLTTPPPIDPTFPLPKTLTILP